MEKRKLFTLLMTVLLLLSSSLLNSRHVGHADEKVESFDETSSYYLIHYDDGEQEIVLDENTSLHLLGWNDSSTVDARIDLQSDTGTESILTTLTVSDMLNELQISNHSIFYRIVESDVFNYKLVDSIQLQEQVTILEENENGTSKEEIKLVDTYGTVFQDLGLVYYSTDENYKKYEISKEDYDVLNNEVASINQVSNSSVQLFSAATISLREQASVSYSTHVQSYGWQDFVKDGQLSGTTGESKRLEAIKIKLDNAPYSGNIVYTTHVQSYGWLDSVQNGELSGTTGESKRLEAIKINLTGEMAKHYDVYYRVHAQSFGWLGWAKNGQPAGTEGLAKRLEAIEIVLVDKGGKAPGSTENPFLSTPSVSYSAHVQTYGWLNFVKDGQLSGTTGESKRLEAIKVKLENSPYSGNIVYTTHVQSYGWLNEVANGAISGTSGESKRVEAIQIKLTGDIANHYDVYYRVHAQSFGWLGWAKNGMKAGSEGLSKRLEAIEIKLVEKGKGPAVDSNKAFKLAPSKKTYSVYLDPGHGGSDPGAVAGGLKEADINLDIAKKVESLLKQRGYTVYMSRTGNTTVGLYDRPAEANRLNTDIFVSIHTNSGSSSARGIESYYYKYKPEYPPKINKELHNDPVRVAQSIKLAESVQKHMIKGTGAPNRGVKGAAFAVTRESIMPATLIEVGFISNPSERSQLATDSYRAKIARGIADGIDAYFKSLN
ncbi:hypothetical protein GW534_07910 [Bacillus sp. P1(2020)]|uniref:MurNAc-LAA domain-containing protein n=2 Tax=Pallidibacillus pasinlerensis TaxID=2703818 RepID=A0ABX0A898_9BACI|nr:hypothetical protein [Pallidibacillus pasinlerensis]